MTGACGGTCPKGKKVQLQRLSKKKKRKKKEKCMKQWPSHLSTASIWRLEASFLLTYHHPAHHLDLKLVVFTQ